jgi:hypothetical protein
MIEVTVPVAGCGDSHEVTSMANITALFGRGPSVTLPEAPRKPSSQTTVLEYCMSGQRRSTSSMCKLQFHIN